MACDCCNSPACPPLLIQYDSEAAAKSKCTQFPENAGYASTPPKFYLQRDIKVVQSGTCTFGYSCSDLQPDQGGSDTLTSNFSQTLGGTLTCTTTVDRPTCTSTPSVSGSLTDTGITGDVNFSCTDECEAFGGDAACTGSCSFPSLGLTKGDCSGIDSNYTGFVGVASSSSLNNCSGGVACLFPSASDPDINATSSTSTTTSALLITTTTTYTPQSSSLYSPDCSSTPGGNFTVTTTTTLSVEYTTAKLISDAAAKFTGFSGTWTGSAPYYNLSSTEESVTLRNSKWRIKFCPSPSCYLSIWTARIFVPDDTTVAPTKLGVDNYVWKGTGSPCFTDPTLGVTDPANVLYDNFTGTEIDYKTVQALGNGTIYVVLWKWSMLSTYTPTDPTFATPIDGGGHYSYTITDTQPNCLPA